MSRAIKNIFFRTLAFAGSLVLILILSELVVRLFSLAPPLPPRYGEFEPHDVLPFMMKPGILNQSRPWPGGNEFSFEVRVNSAGFRDREHTLEKPSGVFRILGLGDSYTAGSGARFEDSYLAVLERKLAADAGRSYEVEIIKAGQPRYWTEPERLLLETIGVRYAPDLVLVGITPNDITDTYLGLAEVKARSGFLVTREAYELGPVGLQVYLHSHLGRLVLRRYLDAVVKSAGRGDARTMRPKEVGVPNGFHEADWRVVESELEKMADICRRIGARLVIVHIPTNDFLQLNIAGVPARLAAWAQRQGVPFIDTLGALRDEATRQPVYWKQDIHCNAAGYRVIADVIYEELLRQELFPVRVGR